MTSERPFRPIMLEAINVFPSPKYFAVLGTRFLAGTCGSGCPHLSVLSKVGSRESGGGPFLDVTTSRGWQSSQAVRALAEDASHARRSHDMTGGDGTADRCWVGRLRDDAISTCW
jgi:hypothetical protein